jgi:beta-lactamase regulating signal transducer with metallopeptidase domain
MNALLTGIAHPFAIHAGWMALSILWLSSGVAVLLALWRASMPAATAEAQHRAAVIALVACLLGPALPYVSRAIASPQPTSVTAVAPALHVTPIQPLPSISTTSVTPVVPLPSGRTVAGGVGVLWLLGTTLLWLRLLGGWWVASGVRRRAVPLQSPEADDMIQRHATGLDLHTPLQLLQSPEIEAPVVIGVRRPALIMPDDLAQQLGPEALSPLIAHELAHVKRRDYAVNMVQSVLDALLFFSPGGLWVSHMLREAREFCCDDLSVAA